MSVRGRLAEDTCLADPNKLEPSKLCRVSAELFVQCIYIINRFHKRHIRFINEIKISDQILEQRSQDSIRANFVDYKIIIDRGLLKIVL